jgi:hypothetical protein
MQGGAVPTRVWGEVLQGEEQYPPGRVELPAAGAVSGSGEETPRKAGTEPGRPGHLAGHGRELAARVLTW